MNKLNVYLNQFNKKVNLLKKVLLHLIKVSLHARVLNSAALSQLDKSIRLNLKTLKKSPAAHIVLIIAKEFVTLK